MKCYLVSLFFFFVFFCNAQKLPEIIATNLNNEKLYFLDYQNAYQNGFICPSLKQDQIESFQITFSIPLKLRGEKLFYKIFYQNESYKFLEIKKDSSYNYLSQENFYGSWDNTKIGFKPIENPSEVITDGFIISGNPRNEALYYNENSRKREVTNDELEEVIKQIRAHNIWLESIELKAVKLGVSVEEQMKEDATWMLNKKINNKWQRNPRVGVYSVLVVITSERGLNDIPDYIKNISIQNNSNYINPFYYFLYGEGSKNPYINTVFKPNFLSIKAKIPLKNGFYTPNSEAFLGNDYFNDYVNDSEEKYKNASFTIHNPIRFDSIKNLPISTDFFNDGYSITDYKNNQKKYDSTNRVSAWLVNTQYPGKTFGYDNNEDVIWFKNPATGENEYKKENVGFKTRHGLTYGKYTFKIKMSELLNKENVWTGITNAIWMLYDTSGYWNNRRECKGDGYMPYYIDKSSKKKAQTFYSEIDFEIIKAAQCWPQLDYKSQKKTCVEPESNINKVMVSCTNWDMGCREPKNFSEVLRPIKYNGNTFDLHRWFYYQNALTSKVPELDDELFGGDYYYFQLEWNPTELIWRIGPEKNNLHVVGYMNDKVTSIPNNQMITVFTQEYHYSHWWPNAPFLQEDIPFPKGDLSGKLFSIEIE